MLCHVFYFLKYMVCMYGNMLKVFGIMGMLLDAQKIFSMDGYVFSMDGYV